MAHITRTPDAQRKFLANRSALEMRTALKRHTEAVNVLAVRAAIQRLKNPMAAETAEWKKSVLADLARPRTSRSIN